LVVFRGCIIANTNYWGRVIISRVVSYSIKTLLIFFVISFNSFAGNTVDIADCDQCDITKYIETRVVKSTNEDNLDTLKVPSFFSLSKNEFLRLNNINDIFWGKINLTNKSEKDITKRLYLDISRVGLVSFYIDKEVYRTGSSLPLHKRFSQSIYNFVDIKVKPGEVKNIFFAQKGYFSNGFKVFLYDIDVFKKLKTKRENYLLLYVGAITALIIYNLMLVVFFKSNRYLIYCFFALSFILAVLNFHGVLDYFDIFSNTTFSHYLVITTFINSILLIEFGFIFLDGKKYLSELTIVKNGLNLFLLLTIFLALTPLYSYYKDYFAFIIDPALILTLFLLTVAAIMGYRRRAPMANIYIISWIFILIGAFFHYGNLYNFLAEIWVTEYGFLFANIFEMIILSLGLAYKVIVFDNKISEANNIAIEKDRYQQLLRTLSHDILNSLQVVILSSRRLKRVLQDDKNIQIAKKIYESSFNVVEILEQVKAQEKLYSDKSNIKIEKVNLVSILNENFSIFEDRLKEKNIIIKTDIPHSAQFVAAERISLKNNVIGNIISNSIKFAPMNSVIYINSVNENDHIKFTIKDEGSGFSADALKIINSKKQQTGASVSTIGTSGEIGTGFGLKIIIFYILLYEADIKASNDNGAKFEIEFKKFKN